MAVIPALPDTERTTSYSATTTTAGPYDVGFALYGNGTDPENWIEVYQDGVKLDSADWTLDSPSGSLATLARPIIDARVTLVTAVAGTVSVPIDITISGRRRPRRTSQAAEGSGVSAHDFNQIETDNVSVLREHHDRFSRIAAVPPGETQEDLPAAADRAGKLGAFDVDGNFYPAALGDLVPVVTDPDNSQIFPTMTAFAAATIPASIDNAFILGKTEIATGQVAVRRVVSEPATEAKIRSTDRYLPDATTDATNGGWWEFILPGLAADLDAFGASDGVAPHTAFNNALAAGVRHFIFSKPYSWTGQAVVSVAGCTLDFRATQVKSFSGDVFSITATQTIILHPRWTANGSTYTGRIFNCTTFRNSLMLCPICFDLADAVNSAFWEVTAANASGGSAIVGGVLTSVSTRGHHYPDLKLYGDDTKADTSGTACCGFTAVSAWIDLGGSNEARVANVHNVMPLTWSDSGGFGTSNAHFSNCRLTDQDEYFGGSANNFYLEGTGHVMTGCVSGAFFILNGSECSHTGNRFGSLVTINGTENRFSGNCAVNGYEYGASGTGWIDNEGETTIATDANFTISADSTGTSASYSPHTIHTGTLTANRTVTLATTRAYRGMKRKLTRTGTGTFNLNFGGLISLRPNGYTWAEATYDGAAWSLTACGNTQGGSFTPTWASSGTQPVLNNGTLKGRYTVDGEFVTVWIQLVCGTTTTYGTGTYTFATGLSAHFIASLGDAHGTAYGKDTGTAYFIGFAEMATTVDSIAAFTQTGVAQWAATVPHTWASTDKLTIMLRYPII